MPEIEKIKGKAEGKPATKRVLRGRGISNEEIVDLDVTPVMNLFLVLIPFLVSMAVFTHLAVVKFSLPPAAAEGAGSGEDEDQQELDVSIVIKGEGYTIMGTAQKLAMVPKVKGKYDFGTLERQLKAIKYKYPRQESIILVVAPEVIYDDIIHFMDKCRESQFPNIGLSGGFQ